MSTRRFLWALAFFSTSALAAAPRPDAPVRAPEQLKQVELEGRLAKATNIYLLLDPDRHVVEIRARGVALERVPLVDVVLLAFQPFLGEAAPPPLAVPAVWTVAQGPGDTESEVIAPVALKPYPTEEEEEEQAAAAGTPAKKPGAPEVPEKSTSYRVQLDNGWQLLVVNQRPQRNVWHRYLDAIRDGWQRLRDVEPSHPPLVTLIVSEEGAQRLHHLFRADMPILVGRVEG